MEVENIFKEGLGMSSINFSMLNQNYFGVSSSGVSSLFGSLSGSNAGSVSGMSGLLSDYASIRSGSYGKLLRTYYSQGNADEKASSASDSVSNNKLTNTQLITERDAAKNLKESAAKLLKSGEDSLFNKKEVKGEDGKVSSEYDMDAIYDAVSDFVKDYNSTVETLGKSNTNSVLNAGSRMVSLTSAMAKNLSKVGITVGLNNKLTVDEEKFKEADISNVKTLFNGTGSYAYSVSTSASSINNSAVSQISRLNGGLYTSAGSYGNSYAYSGSLYSSFF